MSGDGGRARPRGRAGPRPLDERVWRIAGMGARIEPRARGLARDSRRDGSHPEERPGPGGWTPGADRAKARGSPSFAGELGFRLYTGSAAIISAAIVVTETRPSRARLRR